MNIEKTLQLIAESQARADRRADRAEERADRADERADKADERADKADKRADKADQRMDRFEKQLIVTAKLVRVGMKIVGQLQKSQKELDYKFNALMDSQMRTEAAMRKTDEKFDRLLELLRRRNSNGHRRHN